MKILLLFLTLFIYKSDAFMEEVVLGLDDMAKLNEHIETVNNENDLFKCRGYKCFRMQITKDMADWSKGVSRDQIKLSKTLPNTAHYQIIDHKVYRTENCIVPTRCMAYDVVFERIAEKLKDVEFVVNLMSFGRHYQGNSGPLFSRSKHYLYHDFLVPCWSYIGAGPVINEIYPKGVGEWDKSKEAVYKAGKKTSFGDKIDKAFFRGSRNNPVRDVAVKLSVEYPDLYDAKYTKNQAWKSIESSGNYEPVDFVSYEEHCKYRYLLDLPSNTVSTRTRHLFLCGSLVFKPMTEYREFYEEALRPWVHYVPVNKTLEDLDAKYKFMRENADLAKKIAENGRDFIYKNLNEQAVADYWTDALNTFSELIAWDVKRDPDLVSTAAQRRNNIYAKDEL